jgi:hypothetical protein
MVDLSEETPEAQTLDEAYEVPRGTLLRRSQLKRELRKMKTSAPLLSLPTAKTNTEEAAGFDEATPLRGRLQSKGGRDFASSDWSVAPIPHEQAPEISLLDLETVRLLDHSTDS